MKNNLLISAVVALLITNSNAVKLHQKNFHQLRYEESEGPTKADNGDSDNSVIYREDDINNKSEKASGWTNPLSWTDNGEDDDEVLMLKFKSLNENGEEISPDRKRNVKDAKLDEDIEETQESEKQAEIDVKNGNKVLDDKEAKDKVAAE